MVLQNNLVTGDAVSRGMSTTVKWTTATVFRFIEQTTPRYNVTRTENGVKDLSAGTDGTVFGSELFEVTGTFNANMGWGDFVKIKSIGDARQSQALLGAATSMAEKIDAYMFCRKPHWHRPIGLARMVRHQLTNGSTPPPAMPA
jgi:hypothetical protein